MNRENKEKIHDKVQNGPKIEQTTGKEQSKREDHISRLNKEDKEKRHDKERRTINRTDIMKRRGQQRGPYSQT
jgi:hypothetical protein